MYYIEPFFNEWMIKKEYDDVFLFGPFESEGDAHFVSEMLNQDKLRVKLGVGYGEEDIKDTKTVHEHA
ncbi:hypothetical protein QO179_24890 [Bacillus stercoris]|nr:hypothetical protein [Bacillus stercoris]